MGFVAQAAKIHLNKLLVLQKRALRLINFASFQTHAIPFFEYHKILPLNSLYFKLISIIMHDLSNGLAPVKITKLFTPASLTHKYSTRFSAAGNLSIKFSRTQHMKKSFLCTGANNIPTSIPVLPKYEFKQSVHRRHLDI